MEPTETQRNIIEHQGNVVVMASPGSGKTYVISEKIKEILKQDTLYDYQGVIAISYTRKASAHLKNRSLEGGLSSKNSFFGTIDSFCLTQIILGFGNYVIGYPQNEISPIDIKDLPKERQKDFQWIITNHPDYDDIIEDEWKSIFDFYREGKVLIQSIELLALRIFRGSQACRNYIKARFKYVFIDEYQDADTYTDELLREFIALGLTGFVVGDKNQSIFGFAHKDSKYLQGLIDNDDFTNFILSRNFRCAPSIINYSNRLLNDKCNLVESLYNEMYYVLVEGGEDNIADFLSYFIPLICKKSKISQLSEVAILVKNKRTENLIDRALSIHHRLIETTVLDQDLNPCSRLYALLLQFYFDHSIKLISILDEFIDYDELSILGKKRLLELKDMIRNVKSDEIDNLLPLFSDVSKLLMPHQDEGLSMDKLKQVINDEKMLESYKPLSKDEIVLMTLHKSKGLEFDYVFHLNMNEWELPAKRPKNGSFEEPDYISYEQDLDLHYVGITRARKVCFLIGSTYRTNSYGGTSLANKSEFLNINGLHDMRINLYYSNGKFEKME